MDASLPVMAAAVSALVSYPVKSCTGMSLERATLDSCGLEHDRTFMIVSAEDGVFLSQREVPALALICPTVFDGGTRLALAAQGHPDLDLDVRHAEATTPVRVHSWEGIGIDQGEHAARWVSSVLDVPARLIRASEDMRRSRTARFTSSTYFADAYPLLVAARSSLDTLNTRIAGRGSEPVPMDRFRPNIVITGWAEQHTEDRVDGLGIGTAELGFQQQCVRCTIPLVEQRTGRRAGPEPIRTLADYRKAPDGGVTFAAYYTVLGGGQVSIGDNVTVRSWLPPSPATPS